MKLPWLSYAVLCATVVFAYEAPTELKIETTFSPAECETKAAAGDKVQVHYTGMLHKNSDEFDSSLDRGQPLSFTLGAGHVIKGWDQGLQGMCVKEQRKLTIPSHLAYGSKGFGSIIPPDSALVFEVELVSVEPRAEHNEL